MLDFLAPICVTKYKILKSCLIVLYAASIIIQTLSTLGNPYSLLINLWNGIHLYNYMI